MTKYGGQGRSSAKDISTLYMASTLLQNVPTAEGVVLQLLVNKLGGDPHKKVAATAGTIGSDLFSINDNKGKASVKVRQFRGKNPRLRCDGLQHNALGERAFVLRKTSQRVWMHL
jgi:hypothetical protein